MEFVYMTREGVENGAKVPITAVPHWEGHGWVRSDPPPKPTPIRPDAVPPDQVVEELLNAPLADAKSAEPATPKTKKQPSTRLKED